MGYSAEVVRRARQRLAEAKQAHEQEQQEHLQHAYACIDGLQEVDRKLRGTLAGILQAALRAGQDLPAAMEQVRAQNLALQEQRQWLIDSSDLEEGYLDDGPFCPVCGGSGYIGSQMCECLKELCRQEQKKELTCLFGTGKERFENFRLDVYPGEYWPELGTSPRELMQMVYLCCRRYAQSFRPETAVSMLFYGSTGLGKTYLSACIARVVSDSGYSVCYDTACQIFQAFEQEKFGQKSEEAAAPTRKYFDCDLLIVDDLGTEMTTTFTVSALYQLINGRLLAGRPVIISTNLAQEELGNRYSPQIASRILGTYQRLKFVGNDIRMRN